MLKVRVTPREPVRVDPDAHGVRLTTESESLDLAVAPDFGLARRLTALARRRQLVEIVLDGNDRGYGIVTAIWHRMPHRRSIPLSAALALAVLGVPAQLRRERSSS